MSLGSSCRGDAQTSERCINQTKQSKQESQIPECPPVTPPTSLRQLYNFLPVAPGQAGANPTAFGQAQAHAENTFFKKKKKCDYCSDADVCLGASGINRLLFTEGLT